MEQAVLKLVQHVLETQAAALELYARAWCNAPEDVERETGTSLIFYAPAKISDVPVFLRQASRRLYSGCLACDAGPAGEHVQELGNRFGDGFLSFSADGAARFLPMNIDPDTLRALLTPAGKEPVNFP